MISGGNRYPRSLGDGLVIGLLCQLRPQLDNAVIRVHTLTEATGDDATTGLDLLTAVEGPLVRVTADAASDTVAIYETATARGATVVIPPARTANVSGRAGHRVAEVNRADRRLRRAAGKSDTIDAEAAARAVLAGASHVDTQDG